MIGMLNWIFGILLGVGGYGASGYIIIRVGNITIKIGGVALAIVITAIELFIFEII